MNNKEPSKAMDDYCNQESHQESHQAGFTLIELMVAVTLSLFLLSGVAILYLNTFALQRDSSRMVNLNDNARTALTIIARDLRSAGYSNGLSPGSIDRNGLTVTDDCSGLAAAMRPSPALMAGQSGNNILGCASGQAGNYTVADGMPSDWLLFRGTLGALVETPVADANYLAASTQEGRFFRGANTPVMTDDTEIRQYQFSLFYLRGNQLMLTRLVNDALVEVTVANNIEAMRVVLGMDDNGDGQVNRYLGVPNTSGWSEVQWNRVKSVKLHLLSTTDNDPAYTDTRTYRMGDITVDPDDGDQRHRMLASTTVNLYNHGLN